MCILMWGRVGGLRSRIEMKSNLNIVSLKEPCAVSLVSVDDAIDTLSMLHSITSCSLSGTQFAGR